MTHVKYDVDYQVDETVRSRVQKQACAVYRCNDKPTSGSYEHINRDANSEIYVLLCDKHKTGQSIAYYEEMIKSLQDEIKLLNSKKKKMINYVTELRAERK